MPLFEVEPYEPINVLKPVAPELWIVDGPVIGMEWLGLTLPFPTRMTVIRLRDGSLWLHSPTALTTALAAEIDRLGPVRYLIAPNKIHYWWVGDWQRQYPLAESFGAPGVRERMARHGARLQHDLTAEPNFAWAAEIDQLLVPGGYLTEAVFLHRPTRSLILADLIENFEAEKLHGSLWRWLVRASGAMHPNGSVPKDLRFTFRKYRPEVKRAVESMLAWQPARILLAHGRCFDRDATAQLRRAFRWAGVRPSDYMQM